MNEKKTVSFSSTPMERSKNIISTPDCLDYMRNGSDLVKLHPNGRQYKRTFYLDCETNDLRWFPTNKKKNKARIGDKNSSAVTMEEVREVRRGINKCSLATLAERSFTVVYGPEFEALCLVAPSAEEANIWIAGLTRLTAASRLALRLQPGSNNGGCGSSSLGIAEVPTGFNDLEPLLDNQCQTRDKWLQEVFSEADYKNKGFLDDMDVIQLMKSLNTGVNTVRIKHKLKEVDITRSENRGRMTSEEFVNLFKEISTRPEIFFLLIRYSSNGDFLSVDDLLLFLEAEQGLTGVTREQCGTLIQSFEPSPEGKLRGQLGIDGFTTYLVSSDCDIFDPDNASVCQDMTQPLPHYFIASSFNTYLMEDQLKGPSSINGYIRALNAGCRFIKMDVWDGPMEEPIIYHGDTLTSKLALRKTLEQINKYAFVASCYPVILAIENHCSVKQQYTLTSLLRLVFGERIYTPPKSGAQNDLEEWPSPAELREKVILVGKKLCGQPEVTSRSSNEETVQVEMEFGYVSEESEDFEATRHKLSRNQKASSSRKMKLMRELSDLIFLNISRFDDSHLTAFQIGTVGVSSTLQKSTSTTSGSLSESGFVNATNVTSLSMSSSSVGKVWLLSESQAMRLAAGQSSSHTMRRLTRERLTLVYPNATRVDSSNYNPQDIWNCGSQMVALHYQTVGMVMDIQAGFFMRNGACGYVLKPDMMRHQLLLDMTMPTVAATSSSAATGPLAAPAPMDFLSMHQQQQQSLHVRVISAQQLPKPRGSTAKGAVLDPYVVVQLCGTPSDCAEQRTKTVPGNAHNPVFDESFEFDVSVTELALLRFLVLDDESIGDDFIGQFTIPFDCIQTGYRHVNLLSSSGEKLNNSRIFVHVAITNRRGGGKKSKRGRSLKSKGKKYFSQIKKLGVPLLDDSYKGLSSTLRDSYDLRHSICDSLSQLRASCQLPPFCNLKQCLRTVVNTVTAATATSLQPTTTVINDNSPITDSHMPRHANPISTASSTSVMFRSSPSTPSLATTGSSSSPTRSPMTTATTHFPVAMTLGNDETPKLVFMPNEVSSTTLVPDTVKRSMHDFDELMHACRTAIQDGPIMFEKIDCCRKLMLSQHESLDSLCEQNDIKIGSRKAERVLENYVWNLRLLQGQCDLLSRLIQEASEHIQAAKDTGTITGLLSFSSMYNLPPPHSPVPSVAIHSESPSNSTP